jgi:hypothetical protein
MLHIVRKQVTNCFVSVLIFFYLFSLHLFLFSWLNFLFLFASDLDCFYSMQKKQKQNLFLGFEAKHFIIHVSLRKRTERRTLVVSLRKRTERHTPVWQIQFYFEFTALL